MTRSMTFDVRADGDARDLAVMATAVERLETQLKALDRLRIEPTAQLNITPATRAITQLQSRLQALRNVRATVQIDGAAEARRDVTALVVEMRKLRNVRVRIDVDGDGRAQVTALATQLRTMTRDVKVKVGLDDGTFARDIARLHQRISALNGARVRIEFDVQPPGIRAELELIAQALRNIRDTRARVDVDTSSATAAVASLGSALGKIGKGGAVALSIPGLVNLIGQVASLGGEVASLSGVLGLLPAAGAIAAAGIGTLVVGLQGFGEAMKQRGDPEKFAEAIKQLSPAAREAAVAIRDLGPAWDGMRLEVQEALFNDLTDTIGGLSNTYLPVLRTGLVGVAQELNEGAFQFAAWAQSGRTVEDVNTILGNTRTVMRELAPAGMNVAAALTDIATVGSDIMPELAAGATEATGRFREFVAAARESGQLEQWIRGGITTLEQLGRIAGNTGGILGSVFQASETAGYGFLDAVEQITGELDDLLSSRSGQNALVAVFEESRDAINATLPGMRELGSATLETTGAFARSDGLERFAELVSQTASAISPLVAQVGELGGEALGNLAGGASLAVSALAPLVGGTAAVVDGLGPIPGLVLASVVAFKGLGLATAAIVGLGARIAATAALTSTLTAGLTGSVAAGALAQGAMTRLGGAVSALGRALPLIGVGLIAAAAGYDLIKSKSEDLARSVINGSMTMQEAIRAETSQIENRNLALTAAGLGFLSNQAAMIEATAGVTAAYRDQLAAMSPLEQAQVRAREAQAAYNAAVRDVGPNSLAARDAAAALAAATDDVAQAQFEADQAALSYSDRLREQAEAASNAITANLDYSAALRQVADSQQAANDAAAEYGVGSEQATIANEKFTRDALAAADSAQALAESLSASLGPQAQAEAGTAAYGAALLQTAATASGPARDALLGHLDMLGQAELDSYSAGAAALGFSTQLLTLPSGKTVTIAVDPETGEIVTTQGLLDGMRDGEVAINLETQQALDELASLIGMVNGASGTVTIDGNPQAAGTALQTVLGQIAAGQEYVSINGRTVPAQDALGQILGQIGASNATVTINGQSVPAAGVLRDILGAISAGQGTVTINGQSVPARSALAAIVGSVNAANGIMTILARDGGVAAMKAALSRPSSSLHTIHVVTTQGYRTIGSGTQTINHDGNLIPARSTWYATGGMYGARPFTAGTSQIFPPRHLRYTGDRASRDEFYIVDDDSRRSLALGTEWARRRGMELKPRDTASTVTAVRTPAASSGGSAGPSLGSPGLDIRRAMDTRWGNGAPAAARVDLTPMLRELSSLGARMDGITAAVREARPINVTSTGDGVAFARDAQWRMRMPG